jgi:hypothetical protein
VFALILPTNSPTNSAGANVDLFQVNVIRHHLDRMHLHVAHCCRLANQLNKALFDTIRQHRAAVLGAPNHMILEAENSPAIFGVSYLVVSPPGCVIATHLTIKREAALPLSASAGSPRVDDFMERRCAANEVPGLLHYPLSRAMTGFADGAMNRPS